MTDWESLAEELAALEPGARLVIEDEDGRTVRATVEDSTDYRERRETEDEYSEWIEGEFSVPLWVDDGDEKYNLLYPGGVITADTDGGEWKSPTVAYYESLPSGVDSMEELDGAWSEMLGDWIEIRSLDCVSESGSRETVIEDEGPSVPAGAEGYRRRALERMEPVRLGTVERVVLADAVVSYVADARVIGPWSRYEQESDAPSVGGFLDWLTAEQFHELMTGYGPMVFPRRSGEFEVSQRSWKDMLEALRYFHDGDRD